MKIGQKMKLALRLRHAPEDNRGVITGSSTGRSSLIRLSSRFHDHTEFDFPEKTIAYFVGSEGKNTWVFSVWKSGNFDGDRGREIYFSVDEENHSNFFTQEIEEPKPKS
jgi:hypothetical protein